MRIYALVEGLSFVGVLILLFLLEGSNVLGRKIGLHKIHDTDSEGQMRSAS